MSEPSIRDIVAEALLLIQRFEGSNTKDAAQAREIQSAFKGLCIRHGFEKLKEPEKETEDLKDQFIKTLKNHLEAFLPGLFGYLKTKDHQKKDIFLGLSLNLDLRRVSEVFSKLATHSLKLSNPAAFGRAPIDTTEVFELSDTLVGSHVVPMDARYDCSANAALAPYLRQVRHALANQGRFVLPSDLNPRDLPESVLTHIAGIEAVVGRSGEQAVQPVHYGVPQVLLPDASSETGYISVTPAACGGLVAQLSERFTERKERAAALKKEQEKQQRAKAKARNKGDESEVEAEDLPAAPLPVIHTRQYMKAVSKMMNLSQVVRSGSAILIAAPPVNDSGKREAALLAYNLPHWVAAILRRHAIRKDSVGKELRAFTELFNSMDAAATTNARERLRLAQHIRFFGAVLANQFAEVLRKHGPLVEKLAAEIPSHEQLAEAIAQQINEHLEFAAAPELVAEWAEEVISIVQDKVEVRHVVVA